MQASLLLPGFILAEATLSYVGLGFPDTVPTLGDDAARSGGDQRTVALPVDRWPRQLAIFVVTLATNPSCSAAASDRRDRRTGRSRSLAQTSDHQITRITS